LTGSAAGAAVDGSSRVASTSTCMAAHVTLEARYTLPEYGAQLPGEEKSSAPSIVTGPPSAWITNGLPATPETLMLTCSG